VAEEVPEKKEGQEPVENKAVETPVEEIKACSEEEKKRLLGLSGVSISLETYDDIFSDFDPRDYSKRGLSEDFINEVKKASRAKPTGGIELRLLVPEERVNHAHEHVIKERLRNYFSHHATMMEKEAKAITIRGLAFVIAGMVLMMVATIIKFSYGQASLMMDFLIILFEPGGWFLFWEGLNILLLESKKLKPEVDFHRKVSKSEIEFIPY